MNINETYFTYEKSMRLRLRIPDNVMLPVSKLTFYDTFRYTWIWLYRCVTNVFVNCVFCVNVCRRESICSFVMFYRLNGVHDTRIRSFSQLKLTQKHVMLHKM